MNNNQADNPVVAKIVEDFEHEFDVLTESLKITKPVFDGRLGDPALTLKRFLTRFVKHRVSGLVENEPLASQDVAKKPTPTAPTSVNREEE